MLWRECEENQQVSWPEKTNSGLRGDQECFTAVHMKIHWNLPQHKVKTNMLTSYNLVIT